MSKGSNVRPHDRKLYAENYDATFNKCSDHPNYKIEKPPVVDCAVCRRLWREKQLKGASDAD